MGLAHFISKALFAGKATDAEISHSSVISLVSYIAVFPLPD